MKSLIQSQRQFYLCIWFGVHLKSDQKWEPTSFFYKVMLHSTCIYKEPLKCRINWGSSVCCSLLPWRCWRRRAEKWLCVPVSFGKQLRKTGRPSRHFTCSKVSFAEQRGLNAFWDDSKNSIQEKEDAHKDKATQQSIPLCGTSFQSWTSESRPFPGTRAVSVFRTEVPGFGWGALHPISCCGPCVFGS